jgi:hypothetical protein
LDDQAQPVFFPQSGQGRLQSFPWSRTRPIGSLLNPASNYQTFVQSINDPGYSDKTAPLVIQSVLPSSFVSSCSLWLDAKDPSTLQLGPDSSTITLWSDKSGSFNNLTGAINVSPFYTESGFAAIFNGTSSLQAPDTILPVGNSPYSLFTVATIPSTLSEQFLLYISSLGDGVKFSSLQFYDSIQGSSIGYIGTQQKILLETVYTTSTHIQRLNGVEFRNSSSSGNPLTQSPFVLGADTNGSNGLVGNLHELLYFSSVLSDKDLGALEFYLKRKWDIQTYNPTDTSLDGVAFPCCFWLDMTDTRTWTLGAGETISTIQDKSFSSPMLLNLPVSTPTTTRAFPIVSTSVYGKSTLFFDGSMGIGASGTNGVKGDIHAMFMIGRQRADGLAASQNQTVLGHSTLSSWSAGYTDIVSSIASATVKSASTLLYNGYGYQITTAGSNSAWGVKDQPFLLSMTALDGTNTEFNGLGFDRITDGSGFYGDIGEIICFSSTLTHTQQKTVENYLIAKWGIWKADDFY